MFDRICALTTCILARQASSESDVGIYMRYVLLMFNEHVGDPTYVLPRHMSGENDLCITINNVNFMFDGICVLSTCILDRHGLSENAFCISMSYVLFMFNEHVDDKAPRSTQVCPKSFNDCPKIAPT